MHTTEHQSEPRIPVVVRAPDPISLAGVTSQLSQQRGVRVVEGGGEFRAPVAVVVTATMDDSTIAQLRRLVRIDGARVVLVADQIREAELLAVIECGVGAILWRHQATPAGCTGPCWRPPAGRGTYPRICSPGCSSRSDSFSAAPTTGPARWRVWRRARSTSSV